jgi:hypothetical protein
MPDLPDGNWPQITASRMLMLMDWAHPDDCHAAIALFNKALPLYLESYEEQHPDPADDTPEDDPDF